MSVHSLRAPDRRSPALGLALGRIALAVGLGLGALPAHSAPLTLDDALRLAQERSRQLVAQDAATSSARQMALAAQQQPDPIVRARPARRSVRGVHNPSRAALLGSTHARRISTARGGARRTSTGGPSKAVSSATSMFTVVATPVPML